MKAKAIVLALVAVGVVGAGGYGLYSAGIDQGLKLAAPAQGGTAPAGAA